MSWPKITDRPRPEEAASAGLSRRTVDAVAILSRSMMLRRPPRNLSGDQRGWRRHIWFGLIDQRITKLFHRIMEWQRKWVYCGLLWKHCLSRDTLDVGGARQQ
jgi:hypothetical protein